jgi:hypothetical protein
VGNVYFLSRIGLSLRWATEGAARDDLPTDVRQLLAQLDELEAQDVAENGSSRTPPPSDRLQREP